MKYLLVHFFIKYSLNIFNSISFHINKTSSFIHTNELRIYVCKIDQIFSELIYVALNSFDFGGDLSILDLLIHWPVAKLGFGEVIIPMAKSIIGQILSGYGA